MVADTAWVIPIQPAIWPAAGWKHSKTLSLHCLLGHHMQVLRCRAAGQGCSTEMQMHMVQLKQSGADFVSSRDSLQSARQARKQRAVSQCLLLVADVLLDRDWSKSGCKPASGLSSLQLRLHSIEKDCTEQCIRHHASGYTKPCHAQETLHGMWGWVTVLPVVKRDTNDAHVVCVEHSVAETDTLPASHHSSCAPHHFPA